ncbi:MAG: hypothetical protein ACJAVL_001629 [Bacteroidia bacterium]|jgi:hypothetical protein
MGGFKRFEIATAVLKKGVNRSPNSEVKKRSSSSKIPVTTLIIDKWTIHFRPIPQSANQYIVPIDRTPKKDR